MRLPVAPVDGRETGTLSGRMSGRNLRQFALVLEPDELDVFSTGFTVLTPTAVPFSFLYLATTTDLFVAHLVNYTTGVSYPAVRPEDFERAELLVPKQSLLNEFHGQCQSKSA